MLSGAPMQAAAAAAAGRQEAEEAAQSRDPPEGPAAAAPCDNCCSRHHRRSAGASRLQGAGRRAGQARGGRQVGAGAMAFCCKVCPRKRGPAGGQGGAAGSRLLRSSRPAAGTPPHPARTAEPLQHVCRLRIVAQPLQHVGLRVAPPHAPAVCQQRLLLRLGHGHAVQRLLGFPGRRVRGGAQRAAGGLCDGRRHGAVLVMPHLGRKGAGQGGWDGGGWGGGGGGLGLLGGAGRCAAVIQRRWHGRGGACNQTLHRCGTAGWAAGVCAQVRCWAPANGWSASSCTPNCCASWGGTPTAASTVPSPGTRPRSAAA